VLQGVDEFLRWELVQGVWTWGVDTKCDQIWKLAEICQQSHMSVIGCKQLLGITLALFWKTLHSIKAMLCSGFNFLKLMDAGLQKYSGHMIVGLVQHMS